MRRGLLGFIRRHRWAVDLIAGYALILNLLISAVMGTHAIAAAIDPSLAFLDAPICSLNPSTEPGKQPQPAKDGSDCPLCGTACPMGIVSRYASYYNETRTHLSLAKDAPIGRPIEQSGRIFAEPMVGGLHHRYART